MSERLLKATDLPESLWCARDATLVLPAQVGRAYAQMLAAKGLRDLTLRSGGDNGPVGGIKEEDTKRHFATRFSSSSARVQLAALDPKGHLRNVSDLFVKAFSGGRIGLLDVPCGAGAASAALLGCVVELRKAKVLPREPLDVYLVGGDISPCAMGYAGELLAAMRSDFEREAIWVRDLWMRWDVLDAESTTAILHAWMEWAHGCREYFVVMANFSGFLQTEGKLKDAEKQLDEVFRWAAQRRSSVVWVEPQTNIASRGLFPRLFDWFRRKLPSRFAATWAPETSAGVSDARYQHPVKSDCCPPVRLNLIRLEATEP